MVDVVGIQKNKAHWQNPDKFDPERFYSESGKIAKNSFQMFGGGLRACPGQYIAMFEMKHVLAVLYNKYDIELANDNVKPVMVYKIKSCCSELMVKLRKRVR
jgi:cytochrome P450